MSLVAFEELQAMSGYKSPGSVREYLKNRQIKYHLDRHGQPWTTLEAINAPLIGRQQKQKGPNFRAIEKYREEER